jgi:ParB-like chromosome segregation protein Spo0J
MLVVSLTMSDHPMDAEAVNRSPDNIPIKYRIEKIMISHLVPHEGTLDWHLKEITEWIERDGFQARPIAVSSLSSVGPEWKDKYMIHDGHHRTKALQDLDCKFAMCAIFDYNNPRIKVFDYDTESISISKELVVRRAVSGTEISPRFDKHFIELENGRLSRFHDNSLIEPELHTPLSELR